MVFALDNVVPWGRSLGEYEAMFSLGEADLGRRILGCADGPASFNAELTGRGGQVVSADPLYQFSAEEIRRRIDQTYDRVIEQTRRNAGQFVWRHVASVEALGRLRTRAMETFLADYSDGLPAGRYVDAALPHLPFGYREFDLALCSHFLFLYSDKLSYDFHIEAISELCRVADEARIFPVLELGGQSSRHLAGVMSGLSEAGYAVVLETVSYEFQKGGNQMLRVRARG